jgi:hypothetical protein
VASLEEELDVPELVVFVDRLLLCVGSGEGWGFCALGVIDPLLPGDGG